MHNCPFCGTLLRRAGKNRYICPNCGAIEEVKDGEEIVL